MKLKVDDFVVRIMAKGVYGMKGYNDTDAKAFLNYVSIWASEAANHYDTLGADALARQAREVSTQIYNTLEATGYYD